MRRLPFFFILIAIATGSSAAAEDAAGYYIAANTLSANDIALEGGRILHLEGIGAPFAADERMRETSRAALASLMGNRKLVIEHVTTDRYGDLVGQVYALDDQGNKIWLQGELLRRGLVFVYPPSGSEARLDEMRALEKEARIPAAGIWGDPAYVDLAFDKAWKRYGAFAFVAGAVHDAERVKSMVYVHFGQDWRETLTVAIAAHDLKAFRAANLDPLQWTGKTIRVRGWVKHDIGPMITVTDPGQIDLLTP